MTWTWSSNIVVWKWQSIGFNSWDTSTVESNSAVDISDAIERRIIEVLPRMTNTMTDMDSLLKVMYLVIGRLFQILGNDIGIAPIPINRNHPPIRSELLWIAQPLIQTLAVGRPVNSNIESVALPLKLELQPLLNVHFPKSKLSQNTSVQYTEAQLIRRNLQTVLDILVSKYVAWVREKTILDLAKSHLELSMMDSLLEIPNRRALDKIIQDYQRLDVLHSTFPVAVMIIDLDHFKNVNDTHGHPMWDAVLRHVATLIKWECSIYKSSAEVFRVWWDELTCVINSCDESDAIEFAEKIKLLLSNTPCTHDNITLTQTVSIGIAIAQKSSCFNIGGTQDKANIIVKADVALYSAKERRNNVQCFVERRIDSRDSV